MHSKPGSAEPTLTNHTPRDEGLTYQELSAQLSDLARSIHDEESDVILATVVRAAVELIPGAEHASLSVVRGKRSIVSHSPTGSLPEKLDRAQTDLGEGPCLEAIYEESTVRVPDMTVEDRWPQFAAQAVDSGIGSMLAFQLYVEDDNLGALNLYSGEVGAFTGQSEFVGHSLASHAAIALADAQKLNQLHQAVASRDVIGQAKGILMERHKITGHQAFLVLAKASSNTNTKLQEIADTLVNTGELANG